MSPGGWAGTAVQMSTTRRRPIGYARRMRIDLMKATLGGAWLIGLGAIALSDISTAGNSRALVFGFGLVPVALMWLFWAPPEAILAPAVARARE